jgi:molecular chaperone DnaJ
MRELDRNDTARLQQGLQAGDEIVEIKLTVPMPRDERSKEILRELAKLNPEDPRAELWKNV